MNLLREIFEICIIPLLGVLTTYVINYIKLQQNKLMLESENELYKKYVNMVGDTVTRAVMATNQTYVETLKAEGKFDKEAQKMAYEKTMEAVLAVLNDEAKVYITSTFGDLNNYLISTIEASVNENKK